MQVGLEASAARSRHSTRKNSSSISVIVPVVGAGDVRFACSGSWDFDLTVAATGALTNAAAAELERRGLRVLRSDAPRGTRLCDAARSSRGATLVFLHADTRLPTGWAEAITARVSARRPWGAFRLGFEDAEQRACLPLIAAGANLRSRLFGLPFGDQAPFVERATYEAIGGHPDQDFLDDLELSLRLRRIARPILLRERVRTCPRRYTERGRLRTVFTNARILWRFSRGATPVELADLYRRRP